MNTLTTTAPQPLINQFKWRTHDGQKLSPSEMETRHLVYTLRMIFNHIAPEEFRVPGGKRWSGVAEMPSDYLRNAVNHMAAEAVKRNDLTAEHIAILKGIRDGYEAFTGRRFHN